MFTFSKSIFNISHRLLSRYLLQSKSFFSLSRSAASMISDGSIASFMYSIYDLKGDTKETDSISSIEKIKSSMSSLKMVDETEIERVSSLIFSNIKIADVLTEFCNAENGCNDDGEVLSRLSDNTYLKDFLIASKRQVDFSDYCAYFLLYPMINSVGVHCPDSIKTYFMRMQVNKFVRQSMLSPPLLQLKPPKVVSPSSQIESVLTPEECLAQLDIRVGKIVDAWNHPASDKLICEKVDLGERTLRSIGSGIRSFHSAEDMKGRLVCVMSNMKQRKLAGYPSDGMLLCASTIDHTKGALIDPPFGSSVGERIQFEGISGDPANPNQVHKKKFVEIVLEYFHTNSDGICCFKNIPFATSSGNVTCKKYPGLPIS